MRNLQHEQLSESANASDDDTEKQFDYTRSRSSDKITALTISNAHERGIKTACITEQHAEVSLRTRRAYPKAFACDVCPS